VQAQLACEPRACFTVQSKSDPLQRLPLAIGATSVDAGYIVQTLCENPALAGGKVAEELAHSNSKAHRRATLGQVGQSASQHPWIRRESCLHTGHSAVRLVVEA
jgi:hypothetical protein